MTCVVGLDTASNRMHWVASQKIDEDHYGWVVCNSGDPDGARVQLFNYANGFFGFLPEGTHVFCEEPLSLQNGKTTRLLGLAAGAIFGAFVASGVDAHWHWVDQSTWKKEVLGRGAPPKDFDPPVPKAKRTKEWIRQTVRNNPGFLNSLNAIVEADFANQLDLYDAWSLKTYGVRVLHGSLS